MNHLVTWKGVFLVVFPACLISSFCTMFTVVHICEENRERADSVIESQSDCLEMDKAYWPGKKMREFEVEYGVRGTQYGSGFATFIYEIHERRYFVTSDFFSDIIMSVDEVAM